MFRHRFSKRGLGFSVLVLLLTAFAVHSTSARSIRHDHGTRASSSPVLDFDLSGSWTGFWTQTGDKPLYDFYRLSQSSNNLVIECPKGGCGWVSGTATIDVTAGTVTALLSGVASDLETEGVKATSPVQIVGKIVLGSAACGWTDAGPQGPMPPPHTANCTVINWDNGSAWVFLQPIDVVHAVQMNHLDVGYDGIPVTGFINNIVNIYFHEYYPRAYSVGRTLKALGRNESVVYTTHPWLVALFLNCKPLELAGVPLQCPSADEITQFKLAVQEGFITWHRGPFNLQPENMDSRLFEYGLSIAADLDALFHVPTKTVLSQRDVPGMTRSVVPLLARNNVSALSIGINPGTCPAQVPPAFVWRDVLSGTEVIALVHPGGYPENPGQSANDAGGIARKECVVVRGFREALCFIFRTDNSGPPMDASEVINNFAVLQSQFPDAVVRASTFDAFVGALQGARTLLPVVTQEIGDIWLQGIASDPLKMAQYRAVNSEISICIKSGECSSEDPAIKAASFWLVKPPEHTWGLPSIGSDDRTSEWSNVQFQAARHQQIYKDCETAWYEQREFTYLAVNELAQHKLFPRVVNALAALTPSRPDLSGFTQLANMSSVLQWEGLTLQFDGTTGALIHLLDATTGFNWASGSSPFAQIQYQTWSETGYSPSAHVCDAVLGGKPGSAEAGPEDATWLPQMKQLFVSADRSQIVVNLSMPEETVAKYGGFPEGYISYNLSYFTKHGQRAALVSITFQWFSKTATRLAESYWMSFVSPLRPTPYQWGMSKLSSLVDPKDVMAGGSQRQHAVDAVYLANSSDPSGMLSALFIASPDVPMVSPVTTQSGPTPLTDDLSPLPGDMTGFAFNLFNNVWNTNYIFWYPFVDEDADSKFRFEVLLTEP